MATINIILRNKQNKDGLYPIVLRIIKDRKIKLISLPIRCKMEHWNGYELHKDHPNCSVHNRIILKKKGEAMKIRDDFELEGEDYTLNQFEEKFRGKKMRDVNVKGFWEEKRNDLVIAGRTGTARSHRDGINSLFKFCNNNLNFRDITPNFLDKYVTYLRSRNNNDGGIVVKMRTIRALFNDAIKKGIVKKEHYPFEIFKVSQFKSEGIKKALTRNDIEKIENLDITKYPDLIDAKNYFVFSYYTRGMNFVDMMKMKWKDIQAGKIYYIRSKTKKPFVIGILDPVNEILEYYKLQNRITSYVFPLLLKEQLSPIQIENRKANTLNIYNKKLKEIAEILKIESNITSYTARHSFATNMKFAGVSTDIISQTLGHRDLSITQTYLKKFENEDLDNATKKLLKEPLSVY